MIRLIETPEAIPVIWAGFWFLVGVGICAWSVDRITRRGPSPARVWQVFAAIILVGLFTLFMMFTFPELFFDWDFSYRRG